MRRAWTRWAAMWGAVLVVAALVATVAGASAKERWLFFAASTLILTAVLHSLLGERFILQRLFRQDVLPTVFGDPRFVPQTLRFVWHLFTVALLGFAALLIAFAAEAPSSVASRIVSGTAGFSAVLTAVLSRGRHLSWVAFAAVAAATWLAS